ncbi:hypothetical protein BO86DRAFT_390376 [Aspergillus japonicus CBS 114.51]|uniref:Uncharacterized protein n=1 Tax=Aspergillus japonicus CBS 114.51 TaxID=1448312 RepID=A0A8T8WX62_ASPJA|nr:hypothetical protein BO86DRAFT_390376 [Aspergillus japonicus CBS 114.51]RAH80413.1 hypothetical protein BO86DRAFT_390376 [Aspergillus japonicus CBS 114.51]
MSDSPMEPSSEPNDSGYSSAQASIEYRESLLTDVRRGHLAELRDSVYNNYYGITDRFGRGEPFQELEPAIRDLWFAFHVWARNISHETPEHDRIVLDFIRFQLSGPLQRLVKESDHEFEVAQTSTGAVLWRDVPLFLEDTTAYFIQHFPTMRPDHRLNFTYFVAKVASTGLLQDRLAEVALLTFREALETDRPLGSLDSSPDSSRPGQTLSDLPIAAFLPAIRAWIFECGRRMINLCDVSWKECDASLGRGGSLFLQATELSRKAPVGLSAGRWLFWIKRVDQIHEQATQAQETKLAEEAWVTLELMLNPLEHRDSPVSRAYKAALDGFIRVKWPEFWALKMPVEEEDIEAREDEPEKPLLGED